MLYCILKMFQMVLEYYFCSSGGICIGGKTGGYVNLDARHPPHTCDSWVIHTDSAGRSLLSSHTFPPSQPLTLNSSPWLVLPFSCKQPKLGRLEQPHFPLLPDGATTLSGLKNKINNGNCKYFFRKIYIALTKSILTETILFEYFLFRVLLQYFATQKTLVLMLV